MPYSDIPEPEFSVGQMLWFPATERAVARLPCPDCLDTKVWKVETPAGQTYEVPCQRCTGGYSIYNAQDVMSLDYPVWKGVARPFTPSGIEVRTRGFSSGAPEITYWGANGNGHGEDDLYASEATAQHMADLKAAAANAAEQAKPEHLAARNIGTLKIDAAKYDQFANGLWNAWYAYRSTVEKLDSYLEDKETLSKEDVGYLKQDLRWESEYRSKENRPLDALVEAVVAAIAGDLSKLEPAFNALPETLRHPPALHEES